MSMFIENKKNDGFTVIELMVSITVIGILAAISAGIIISVTQLFVYLPKEMKAKIAAREIINIIVAGTDEARSDGIIVKNGLTGCIRIIDASPQQVTYTVGYPSGADQRNLRIRFENGKLYRSYSVLGSFNAPPAYVYGNESAVPYYAISSDMTVSGAGSGGDEIFAYSKKDGTAWVAGIDPLTAIERIDITIDVKTGTGAFTSWGGRSIKRAAVNINQYI